MERLTIKAPSGLIHLKDNKEHTVNLAIKQLSAYEDTRLIPEQIKEIDKLCSEQAKELAEYKRLEEEKLLIKLPCKLGTKVYSTRWWDDITESVKVDGNTYYRTIRKHRVTIGMFSLMDVYEVGKTIFLSKKEAKQKLKDMEKMTEQEREDRK